MGKRKKKQTHTHTPLLQIHCSDGHDVVCGKNQEKLNFYKESGVSIEPGESISKVQVKQNPGIAH